MASSKVMPSSSTSRNSDLRSLSSSKLSSISDHNNKNKNNLNSMSVDGLLRNVYSDTPTTETTPFNAEITLDDPTTAASATVDNGKSSIRRTVDDMWNEIVSGNMKECKEEEPDVDEMMTLEDFLARAGAVNENEIPSSLTAGTISAGTEKLISFDSIALSPFPTVTAVDGSGVLGFENGNEVGVIGGRRRGNRRAAVLEPLDKATQQRERRMIKNRESAARSRERKQAYQVELETLVAKIAEENEQLLKERAQWTKERYKLLMEKLVPVDEQQRRPVRVLRRVRSMEW